MFLVVAVAAVAFALIARNARNARIQREAVARIEQLGGECTYDCQYSVKGVGVIRDPLGPNWLANILGIDFLSDVVEVDFNVGAEEKVVSDSDVEEAILALPRVKSLTLNDTRITDAALDHLKNLSDLETVVLEDTDVTPDGVKRLIRAMPHLEVWYYELSTHEFIPGQSPGEMILVRKQGTTYGGGSKNSANR